MTGRPGVDAINTALEPAITGVRRQLDDGHYDLRLEY
jgi:hypothetical protein